jgi:carbon starvation protein
VLAIFFVCLLWLIVADMLRVCARHLKGKPVPPLPEAPHYPTKLEEAWARD